MNLDTYQQEAVNCSLNAVVSAGAGSGKTTVLSQRFLRLITDEHADVSEILTLTFTRKAASEMYERIYNLLLKNLDNKYAAAAVDSFDKASISTLDSFCARIARDCSPLFGIPSSFITDETAVKKLVLDTSLDFILSNSSNQYLSEFIYMNGFERVWKEFFADISMNYLSIGSPKDFKQMFQLQMHTAETEVERLRTAINELVSEILSVSSEMPSIINFQKEISGFSADDIEELKKNMGLLNLKKPGGSSKKPEVLRVKEIIDELKLHVKNAALLIDALDKRELLSGLFELTASFQEELFSRMRASGVLGFNDVLTIAVSGLRRDKELRKYYKGLFRYIMIDEFQDNNELQKELLYLLAEREGNESEEVPAASDLSPDKLFFVGDDKQSIYRFRGADVSVFKELSGEIEKAGGRSISLRCNYRSEPGLIDFFNKVFSHVMHDSSEGYQAGFSPLESRSPHLKSAPEIKLLYKPYDEEKDDAYLSSDEAEAYAISDYIIDARGRLDIAEGGGCRKADFSDFVILFRSGTNQKMYEKVFRAREIPYRVHSVRSLFQEAPVNDIYNLLQICMYPEDRAASAAFLRSPLISLSDASVIKILLSNKPVFSEGCEELCADDADLEKYRIARGLYDEISAGIDREPIARLISRIWYGSGYQYLVLSDLSLHGYLEYYDYFREFAVKADNSMMSMAEFLDSVRENLGEYKKIDDLRIMGYSAGGVEMMPVHQSKGLEFPVVIIANAGNTGLNDLGGSSPSYISEQYGLTFNLLNDSGRQNYFYSCGKEENKKREEAELRRLLYVALTRAQNHLVISGCHGKNNRSGERSLLNMFISAFDWGDNADPFECVNLKPYIKEIPNIKWEDSVQQSGKPADIEVAGGCYSEASVLEYTLRTKEWSATALNREMNDLKHGNGNFEMEGIRELSRMDDNVEKILSDKDLQAEFGTYCHRLIELVLKDERGRSPKDFALNPEENSMFFKNITDKEHKTLCLAGAELADVFLDSDLWKEVKSSVSFESELAFTSVIEHDGEDVFVNGIMDLVFETEKEVRIIDFKTDQRIIPGEYNKQMEIYIEAASELYSKPASCSLFYLRDGIVEDVNGK